VIGLPLIADPLESSARLRFPGTIRQYRAMDIRQLDYFLKVAERRSITAAAAD
jgi:hypothetical protein